MKAETKTRMQKYTKRTMVTLLVLALLTAGGWYYLKTSSQLKAKDGEIQLLKATVSDRVEKTLQIHDIQYLELLMEPFGWAIRNELLKEDISTVHQYIAQFVKSSAVEMVLVNSADGKIISASDKKLEGNIFSEIYPNVPLAVTATKVTAEGNRYYVVHPVMGFDQQIGTIFMIYKADKEQLLSNLLTNSLP
jgi:hypothetical protein